MAWYDDFVKYIGFGHSASETVVKSIGNDVVEAIDYMNRPIEEQLTMYAHLYALYLDGVRQGLSEYEGNLANALKDPKFIIALSVSIGTGQWWAVAALLTEAGLTGNVDDSWASSISNAMGGKYSPDQIKLVNQVLDDPVQGFLTQAQIEAQYRANEETADREAERLRQLDESERLGNDAEIKVNNNLIPAENTIVTITNNITQPPIQTIGLVGDLFDETTASLEQWLTNTLQSGVTLMNGYTAGIFQYISNEIGKALSSFGQLSDTIELTFGSLMDSVNSSILSLTQGTVGAISDILGTVSTTLDDFVSPLYGEINDTLDALHDTTIAEINRAKFYSDSLLDNVEAVVSGVVTSVENIPLAIRETFANIGDGISSTLLEPFTQIGKYFVESALNAFEEGNEELTAKPTGGATPLTQMDMMRSSFWNELRRSGILLTNQDNIAGKLTGLIAYVVSYLFTIMEAMKYEAEGGMQNYRKERPLLIPPATEALELHRRGELTREEVIDNLQKQGFSTDYAAKFTTLTEKIPPEGELITWFLRDIIDNQKFTELLGKSGWTFDNIQALKQGIYGIPPVQDLVTMAVREAFSPDVIQTFRTLEDYPPEFGNYTKQQGISEDWAKRYWIAHWSLPSLEMGYEMLHRGVITDDELDLLMRTQDVMPFWRDKLKAISYNPLTRVDVRRMFDMGILTYDEVIRAYKDIGYNDENANRLAQFTQQLALSNDEDETQTVKELTKSDILQAYEDGTIKRDSAETMLKGIGYSIEATDIFLDAVERKVKRAEIHALADLAEAQYNASIISLAQLEDQLNALGLSETEKRKRLLTVQHKSIRTDKIPTISELNRMLEARALDEDTYRKTAKTLGYSDFWIDKYLTLMRIKND
jgi:hypothetical protein